MFLALVNGCTAILLFRQSFVHIFSNKLGIDPKHGQFKVLCSLAVCILIFRIVVWMLLNVHMITENELFVLIWRLFLNLSVFIWLVFQLLRLRNTFTNTVYQLSNRIQTLLISLLITVIILCTIGLSLLTVYFRRKHSSDNNNNIFSASATITSFQDSELYYFGSISTVANYTVCAVLVILISYFFCNKLLKLTMTIRCSCTSLTNFVSVFP